jgi:hypothetical protein
MELSDYKFIEPDYTLRNNLMAFGFECDKGWYKLIEDCFHDIDLWIKNYEPKLYDDFRIVQVKEKYGVLTIYANYYPRAIEMIIDYYRIKSYSTCEVCGKDGRTLVRGSWYKTLCEEHAKELGYSRKENG